MTSMISRGCDWLEIIEISPDFHSTRVYIYVNSTHRMSDLKRCIQEVVTKFETLMKDVHKCCDSELITEIETEYRFINATLKRYAAKSRWYDQCIVSAKKRLSYLISPRNTQNVGDSAMDLHRKRLLLDRRISKFENLKQSNLCTAISRLTESYLFCSCASHCEPQAQTEWLSLTQRTHAYSELYIM